jgi:hypothetical protein
LRRSRRPRSRRLGAVRGARRRSAFGCPHTLAAAALAVRALRALPLERAQAIDAASLARELDAPREKLGRLLVVEDALRALLAEARRVQ